MKRFLKNFLPLLMAFSIVLTLMPPIQSKAAEAGNVTPTVTYRIVSGTLYIEGTGEIPDYIGADYFSRPWNVLSYEYINIAPTITRVGQYAFANSTALKQVDMWSTTYLANNTCFSYAGGNVIMRIHGNTPAYKQLGNITYSSWDSILVGAPLGIHSLFVLDNDTAASQFRTLRYPYLLSTYSVTTDGSPWLSRENYFKDIEFDPICRLAAPDKSISLSFAREPMSEAFMTNMGNFTQLYNFHYLASYNSYYFEKGKYLPSTISQTRTFILKLDKWMQVPGVPLKLIQITPDGTLYIYDDLDKDQATITFASVNPSGYYVLVY